MKSSCCPVCYKVHRKSGDDNMASVTQTDLASNVKLEEGQQRFFKVLKGYLNDGSVNITGNAVKRKPRQFAFPLEELVGIGMVSCIECFKIMQSFRQLYHQLKTIELLLNWQVGKLKGVMMGAQRTPSRMRHFREFVGKLQKEGSGRPYQSSEEMLSCIVKSKKLLISKCSEKVSNAFPKLEMQKCDSVVESISGNVMKTPTRSAQVSDSSDHLHTTGKEMEMDLTISSPNFLKAQTIDDVLEQMPTDIPASGRELGEAQNSNLEESIMTTWSPEACPFSSEPEEVTGSENGNGIINTPISENEPETTTAEKTGTSQANEGVEMLISSNEVIQIHSGLYSPEKSKQFPPDQISTDGGGPESEVEISAEANHHTTPLVTLANCDIDVDDGELVSEPVIEPIVKNESRELIENPVIPEDSYHLPNPNMGPANMNPPTTDNPGTSNPKETRDIKIGLRSKHQCSQCKRTFSSSERLQSHIEESHHDQSDKDDELNSSSGNEDIDSNDDNDVMNWSASSSEQEDDAEPTLGKNEEDEGQNPGYSLNVKPVPSSDIIKRHGLSLGQNAVPDKYRLRLKCPDCDELHQTFKSFLLHLKDSESCKASYNSTTSVRVEVLAPKLNEEPGLDESRFSTFAIINLPQAIFICDDCGLALYSAVDFEKHKELHGDFPCKFCNFKCTYAPALSKHELQHAKCNESKVTTCPRCDVQFSKHAIGTNYVRHHLKVHFSLTEKNPSCAICKTTCKEFGPSELAEHLKTHHDLSNNINMEECSVVNCGAYYLAKDQLQDHVKVHHVHGAAKGGSRNCKDCNKRFDNRTFLRRHRLECHPESLGDTVFKCTLSKCQDIFQSKRDLDMHVKKKHSVNKNMDGLLKLKCPDCPLLFSNIKEILLHRKGNNSCGGPYDPLTSIRVEIVEIIPEGDEIAEKNVYAVVDLPQEIHICEDCDLETFSVEDREAHKKLHGNFKCKFCRVTCAYAPDIAVHERRCHRKKQISGHRSCPRCDFKWSAGGLRDMGYLQHFLKTHLSLTFNDTKCAICMTTASYNNGPLKLIPHLKQFHDLKNSAEGRGKIKRCTVANCNSYFLTDRQLRHHFLLRHNTDMKAEKRKWKCKDCDKCYFVPQALRDHRLKYHVDSNKVIPCVFENCSIVFESKENLVSHLRAYSFIQHHQPFHDPTKMVQCPTCEASFSGPILLHEHMKSQHGAEKPSHVCEFCGKVFKFKDKLELHYLVHIDLKVGNFNAVSVPRSA